MHLHSPIENEHACIKQVTTWCKVQTQSTSTPLHPVYNVLIRRTYYIWKKMPLCLKWKIVN